ncbi:MAG: formate--tetrahydrofolate ligase, partial [Treponemataceae bacterium]|nr:formate--tetrahydrofolate ligase [Treponemataceae bacterium]
MTDIEIAQQNKMDPIVDIAAKIGLTENDIDLYGKYKAKLTIKKIRELQSKGKKGKLVLVTAITPTPAGEGKSTVSVGLA